MLLQLLQHPLNCLHMLFAFVFGVNENVIKIHYHKNIKLLYQNLVDIALKCGRCISQSKRHELVLEVAIVGLEGHLSFVVFLDLHSMVGIDQIELGETLSPT